MRIALTVRETLLAQLNPDISNASAPEISLMTQRLHAFFDKVRLIDPTQHTVFRIAPDGRLTAEKKPCYTI